MALSVTELQIGDWVLCYNPSQASDNYATIIGICPIEGSIKPHTFIVRFLDDSILVDARKSWVKPIPLTAEILEKNGFKTNNDHTLTGSCIYRRLCGKWNEYEVVVRLLNGWLKVRSYDERWCDLLEVHFQPRYVHELHHALRLCGLNDLADNFVV